MVETYKYKSKFATAISFIAMFIAYMGKDGLAQIMPPEYAWLIPPIVGIAAYIVTQGTENIRVDRAEQMIYEKIGNQNPIEDIDPTAEYDKSEYPIARDDDNGC